MDLLLPKIIYDYNFGVDTSTLLNLLRINLKPTGDDLVVLDNRADDKFSQKVRNLKSHKTLENLGFAIYENNKYFLSSLTSLL